MKNRAIALILCTLMLGTAAVSAGCAQEPVTETAEGPDPRLRRLPYEKEL